LECIAIKHGASLEQGDLIFFQMKSLELCMVPPQGLNFYTVIYWEMFKKYSSQELLHQMGQYLAWSIPRKRKLNFVQMSE